MNRSQIIIFYHLQRLNMDIANRYEVVIQNMYKEGKFSCQNYPIYQTVDNVYKLVGKKQISEINSNMKIIMDNEFAKAIVNNANSCFKKHMNDYEKLDLCISFLAFLGKAVHSDKFVTKRGKAKIDDALKIIQQSKEFKLNKNMKLLLKCDDKEQFRGEFLDILGYPYKDTLDDDEVALMYQKFYLESLKNVDQKMGQKIDRRMVLKIDAIISKFENKQQILGNFQAEIDSIFGEDIGEDDVQLQINKFLMFKAEQQRLQSNEEQKEKLQEHFQEIKKMLDKCSGRKIFTDNLNLEMYLAKFGSIISGFATRKTDMDLTILTNCYVDQIRLLEYVYEFLEIEFKNKKNIECKFKMVRTARIPVLKMEVTSNRGTSSIDLIINNVLGVINSRFLSVYGSVKWVRELSLLIKVWAKNKELISEETFSSYSFNLILIHFLIQTKKIKLIMDARTRDPQSTPHFIYKRKIRESYQQFPVYIQYKQKPEDVSKEKRVNLFEVLQQFFVYFGTNGIHWKFPKEESIITVDGSKEKPFEDEKIFTIKDPFDKSHNPGRAKNSFKPTLMAAFDEGVQVFNSKNQQQIKQMFK